MNRFGTQFRLTLWGESHGPQIGVTIDGVPAGTALAEADFESDLARRRSSGTGGATPRREKDEPQIVSGTYRGYTTGTPLTIVFANGDTRPEEYAALAGHDRPSHADRVAWERSGGHNDPRGGGHFSGRLTLALVAAGTVAKKLLPATVRFATQIVGIGGCTDPDRFDEILRAAAADGDSVGGTVECRVGGIPAGWGEPFCDTVESLAAHLLFAIPGVKGVEFGSGFAAARMRGSGHNDPILDAAGRTATNHAGGIVGGLTNGNELVVRAAFKPTASIAREQTTYNRTTGRQEPLVIGGRHDTCIALRGAAAVEAAVAITLADLRRP
ncbi:MAG: chorismate synthase [Alistipes sp.]|nr:chorismate synthase [Alistipes sp.]